MKNRTVVLILGRTGSGKTTLAKEIMQQFPRRITLDPLEEYNSGVIVRDFTRLYEYLTRPGFDAERDPFVLTFRARSTVDREFLFKFVKEMNDILLTVEEAEIYLDPRSLNEDFSDLINYGRHREISLLAIARRVPEISIEFRAQITEFITFRQFEPRDLDLLERYGFNREEVKNLEEHKYAVLRG